MTLIVSDVSCCGCAMVSETSIATVGKDRNIEDVKAGAKKIIYLEDRNIGIGIWGHACIIVNDHRQPLLQFVADTISDMPASTSFLQVMDRLAAKLNESITRSCGSTGRLEGGIHACGYVDEKPILIHICPNEKRSLFQIQTEFPNLWASRLDAMGLDSFVKYGVKIPPAYADCGTASGAYYFDREGTHLRIYPHPEDLDIDTPDLSPVDRVYAGLERGGFFHLRNGCYYSACAIKLDHIYGGSNAVEIIRNGNRLEYNNPQLRLRAYEELVGEVVDVAVEEQALEGRLAAARRPLDSFIFNADGPLAINDNSDMNIDCSGVDRSKYL